MNPNIMNDYGLLLISLVMIIDCLAIWDIIKRKHLSGRMKFLWIAVIILSPILGITLYYFGGSLSHRNRKLK